jgi:hypothetical protein
LFFLESVLHNKGVIKLVGIMELFMVFSLLL